MNSDTAVNKAKAKLKSGKTLEIVFVIILAVAVIAVLLMTFWDKPEEKNAASQDYASVLEMKLSNVLSQIEGAGEVDVIVTVASEGEIVIAMETTVDKDGNVTTTPVLVGGEVVILEEKKPEITGVLIVSDGADNLSVRFSLLEAAASVLNINQSLIKVYTKGGSGN